MQTLREKDILEQENKTPEKNDKEKQKVKAFKSKVAKSVTIAGFFSITKKYEALLERIADKVIQAIKEDQAERKLDRELRQEQLLAIKSLTEAIKTTRQIIT